MKDNWPLWIGLGFAAYIIYEMSQVALTSSTTGVTAYLPIANSAGNEFTCPSGTVYVDYGEQASGGGYCEGVA